MSQHKLKSVSIDMFSNLNIETKELISEGAAKNAAIELKSQNMQ